MDSTSGISSNSYRSGSGSGSRFQNSGSGSGSDGDPRAVMDDRKRKRMISNRESARRSRLRKQKLLDELTGQVADLRKENGQIITAVHLNRQQYVAVESENAVLRAQLGELSQRLASLEEIGSGFMYSGDDVAAFGSPWGCFTQPVMAAADVGFMY